MWELLTKTTLDKAIFVLNCAPMPSCSSRVSPSSVPTTATQLWIDNTRVDFSSLRMNSSSGCSRTQDMEQQVKTYLFLIQQGYRPQIPAMVDEDNISGGCVQDYVWLMTQCWSGDSKKRPTWEQ